VKKSSNPPPESLAATFAASCLVLVLGLWLLFLATDQGRSFTTENLRREQINRQAAPIPELDVFDSTGRLFSLKAALADDERLLIADFIYTRCTSVCTAMGTRFQQLQIELKERGLANKIGLLSISFDPANDNPVALAAFSARMKMDTAVWRVVSLRNPRDRQVLLDAFGIMVLPAANEEFEHNAAFHFIKRSQLVQILGLDETEGILDVALAAR
jgi:protein SCO1